MDEAIARRIDRNIRSRDPKLAFETHLLRRRLNENLENAACPRREAWFRMLGDATLPPLRDPNDLRPRP